MNENKDLGSAAVRGEAVAETNLAAAMLSIPVEVPFEHQGISQRKAYMAGAEQVRAKAAGLVSARAADALDSQPSGKSVAQWLRNHYQNYTNIASLCDALEGGALDSQPTDGGVRNDSEPGREDEDWFFSPNDGN